MRALILSVLLLIVAGRARAEAPDRSDRLAELPVSSGVLIAARVSLDGMDAWAASAGRGWREIDARPTLDTRWMTPGLSRLATLLVVLQLMREGVLSPDEPIGEALGVQVHEELAGLAVRDLFSGRVWFRTPQRSLAAERYVCCLGYDRLRRPGAHLDEPTGARRRIAAASLRKPLAQRKRGPEPLSAQYTHTHEMSALMLAAILEQRTGRSWESLVEERVLGPLGIGPLRHGPDADGPAGVVWRAITLRRSRPAEVRRDLGAWRPAGGLQLSSREAVVLARELIAPSPTLPIDPAQRQRALFGEGSRAGFLDVSGRTKGMRYALSGQFEGFCDVVDLHFPADRLPWLLLAIGTGGIGTTRGMDEALRDLPPSRVVPL